MKPDIHPDYHAVVFQDATTAATFLTRSTITSTRTSGKPGLGCTATPWWWSKCRLTRTRFGQAHGARSIPPAESKSSTGVTAGARRNSKVRGPQIQSRIKPLLRIRKSARNPSCGISGAA
jgi:ribosomal protein L31